MESISFKKNKKHTSKEEEMQSYKAIETTKYKIKDYPLLYPYFWSCRNYPIDASNVVYKIINEERLDCFGFLAREFGPDQLIDFYEEEFLSIGEKREIFEEFIFGYRDKLLRRKARGKPRSRQRTVDRTETMKNQEELNRIRKAAKGIAQECFWGDYKIDEKDIEKVMIEPYGDLELTKLILSKIIYNSSDYIFQLKRFPKELVKDYIDNLRLGPYRKKDMEKRIAVIRICVLGEMVEYKGLTWKV